MYKKDPDSVLLSNLVLVDILAVLIWKTSPVSEVTDLLRTEGIPDSLLTDLAGMLHAQICGHVCICV